MSGLVLLYSFIVFALLIPCSLCADPNYDTCNNQTCGSAKLPYPFAMRDSGCGLPRFQIDCADGERPVIQIESENYTILESDLAKQISTITNDKNFQECTYSYTLDDAIRAANSVFDSIELRLDTNLTVYRCDDKCVPDIPWSSFLSCPKQTEIVQLGSAHWNIEGNSLYQYCSDCTESGGVCGYNITDPAQFLCYGKSGKKSSNHAVKIGAAIGTGFLFTVALLLAVMYRKRSSASSKEIQLRFAMTPPISKVEKFLDDYTHQMPTRYSYSKLKNITNNFTDKLGEGGFGVVYKGKLQSGDLVAVKILDRSRQSESQFINEVGTIGTLHHVHLVRLMGYCYEGIMSALVYEYMANGSLEKFIFAGRGEERVLRRDQLYSIALGTARGIAYLHEECHSRIIHFDIKPHNILLDEDFTPKVADFGLAKLCSRGNDHMSMTAVRGTPGYAAPEVWSRNLGPVTDKSDVYSFGMLLLEMVGGRKNIELVSRSSQVYFPEWAFKLLEKGQLEMMLRGSGNAEIGLEDEEKARRMTKVGLWCIQYNSRNRPSMSRVVQMLEGSGDVGNPPMPFNSSAAPDTALLSSTEDSSSAA